MRRRNSRSRSRRVIYKVVRRVTRRRPTRRRRSTGNRLRRSPGKVGYRL